MGDSWVHLRLCMECGHVGCCDSSKNKHATKHFHRTKHPLVRSIEPGEELDLVLRGPGCRRRSRRLARAANLFECGSCRGHFFRRLLQVCDALAARARIPCQHRSQNQVCLRRIGIQAKRGARGGDRVRNSVRAAVAQKPDCLAPPGSVPQWQWPVLIRRGILKAAHSNMLYRKIVVGIRIFG